MKAKMLTGVFKSEVCLTDVPEDNFYTTGDENLPSTLQRPKVN